MLYYAILDERTLPHQLTNSHTQIVPVQHISGSATCQR